MAYSRGSSSNIIVGAAALFVHNAGPIGLDSEGKITDAQAALDLPSFAQSATSIKETLSQESPTDWTEDYTNIGYTSNGLELAFQPDFGEVAVDQLLDVARLFKQGMTVNLNTSFAEATLENLLIAIAADDTDKTTASGATSLKMSAGDIGDVPLERGIVAVGPGSGSSATPKERIYVAYRALSIENVTVSAKRDEASMFEVSFRLLPNDDASYGKIVDRSLTA